MNSPANGAVDQTQQPIFEWGAVDQAGSYLLEVATDENFSNIVISETVASNSYTPNTGLTTNTEFYWRVNASNFCGDGVFSSVWRFGTAPALVSVRQEHPQVFYTAKISKWALRAGTQAALAIPGA